MSFSDEMYSNDLMLVANNIRKEYNKTRDHWYHACVRCYHQSISGGTLLEESIQKEFDKMLELKKEYNDICTILKQRRGYTPTLDDKWRIDTSLIEPIAVG